jgi:uncharacterized small protein (DUF1192 family)
MNTTAHVVAPEEVMAFVDGELSASDARAIAAHLDGCAECAGLAEQFRSTSQWLSQWEIGTVPESVGRAVQDEAALVEIGGGHRFLRTRVWGWKPWAIGGGGLMAAFMLILAVSSSNDAHRAKQLASQVTVQTQSEVREFGQPTLPPNMGINTVASTGVGKSNRNGDATALLASKSPAPTAIMSTDGPMISRTVSLAIRVKDVGQGRPALDAMLTRHHGYAAELSANNSEGAPHRLQASLRVPAPELEAAVGELKTLGRVMNESQFGEEVSQQHADLDARLKTSRETEERFRAILQQRTGGVSDVLEVEERIARVRGEIERMEAQQKALEHRVDFATIDLILAEEDKGQLNPSPDTAATRIRIAFVEGYSNAWETVLGMVLFLEEYGPAVVIWLAVIGLPVVLLWRRYRRMHSRV